MAKADDLTSGWKLWKQTFKAYRLHFWRYTGIILIIIVPSIILSAIAAGDPTVAAYGALASLIMNAALIYAVITLGSTPESNVSFRELYYASSSVLVRYIIVGVVLAAMLVPAALGLGLIGLGGNGTAGPPLGELLLLSLVGFIVALPSIYLLVRNGLAIITVYGGNRWPGEALRRSRQITAGRFWAVLARYLILLLGLLVVVLPGALAIIGMFLITRSELFLSLFQVLSVAIILPLLYIYLYKLHQSLISLHQLHEEK